MTDIRQSVAASASQPSVTWRTDSVLDTPKLLFPADETRYCPQLLLWVGASADVTLSWGAVSGASFYVVQICDTSSFSGPTVRGIRTASTSATLDYIDEVSQDRKLYWRVAAYNAAGAASLMSTPRSLELTCPGILGTGYDPDDTPGTTKQYCDYYGVDLEIAGPDQVRLSDTGRTFPLNINYDCKTEPGNDVIVNSVTWTVTQPNADITIDEQEVTHLKLDVSATEEQSFDIKVEVNFVVLAEGLSFTCEETKKVLVEGVLSGGGGDVIQFKILSVSAGIGQGAIGCDFVQAEVTQIACEGSDVSIGDEVRVWDPVYCYFNMPIEGLVGLHGVAHKMDNPIDPYDDLGTDCQYEVAAAGACRWIVCSLCCSEEYEF